MSEAVIHIQGVHKRFPGGTHATRGISLEIQRGEIFGVLGPNGAGKTTLMNMLATLLLPDEGDIQILDHSIRHQPQKIRPRINLCSGNANFAWSLTLRENLRFYAMLYGLRGTDREARLSELLEAFGLAKFAGKRFDEVSTGTKQRLALAKAMINRPEILLLDEPTVGLDPDMALKVRQYIQRYHQESKGTLVLTTHYMQEAEMLCSRIAFIRDGQIRALGTPAELKDKIKAEDLEDVFLELAK